MMELIACCQDLLTVIKQASEELQQLGGGSESKQMMNYSIYYK